MTSTTSAPERRQLLSKVPEVTAFFWVVKVLSTTVGETAADFLADTVGLGLQVTTVVMALALAVVMTAQFRARRYVAGVYWLTVVLISVVGTLVTDNLTDGLGVPLALSSAVFALALTATFLLWHAKEGTLSIHSIHTRRREAFYWLAVLLTFALGTAVGDLVDEQFGLGYWPTAAVVAVVIALVALAHRLTRARAVLAFWTAYVLTRPLGASLGDGLSQPRADGGLGMGTTTTSALFLVVILAVVAHLAVTGRDVDPTDGVRAEHPEVG